MKKILFLILTLTSLSLILYAQDDLQFAKNAFYKAQEQIQNYQFNQAIHNLDTAAKIFLKYKIYKNYVITQYTKAKVIESTGDYNLALRELLKAKNIFQKYINDTSKLSISLYDYLGQLHLKKANFDSAKYYFNKSFQLAQIFYKGSPQLANYYLNYGVFLAQTGQLYRALNFLNTAFRLIQTSNRGFSPEIALIYNNLTNIYLNLGLYQKALEIQEKYLKLIESTSGKNSLNLAIAYRTTANTYIATGEYQTAKDYLFRTLDILRSLPTQNPIEIAHTYFSLGNVFYHTNDFENAIQYYFAALNTFKKYLPPNHPDILDTYANLALIYKKLGAYEQAKNIYIQLINTASKVDTSFYRLPIFYINLGSIYRNLNNIDSALYYYSLAAQSFQKITHSNQSLFLSDVYHNIGVIYNEKNDLQNALKYLRLAVNANSSPDQDLNNYLKITPIKTYIDGKKLLLTLSERIAVLQKLYTKTKDTNYLIAAFNTLKLTDSLINEIQKEIFSEEDKILFAENTKHIYEFGLTISNLLRNLYPDSTKYMRYLFYFIERNKASQLAQAINAAKAEHIAGIPDSLVQKEKLLREAIANIEMKIKQANDLQTIIQNREKLLPLKQQYRELITYFEINYPKYYQAKYKLNFVNYTKLQELLSSDQVILDYFIGREIIYCATITKDSFNIVIFSKPKDFIDTILDFRKYLKARTLNGLKYYSKLAYSIFVNVFPPIDPQKYKQLIIIPDEVLNLIPFEALLYAPYSPDDSTDFSNYPFLAKVFDISYAYSGYLFYTQNTETSDSHKSYSFLGFAPGFIHNYPYFRGIEIPPIPGTIEEVKHIAQLFQDNQLNYKIFIDTTATETNFKSQNLSDYHIVHIATHGFIYSDDPALSALIFSKEDGPNDGVLYVGEIYNLQVNADLVTLSACETGLGKLSTAEGVIGLSRAFFFAGAKNMIISLWKVADKPTAKLMQMFYENLLEQYPDFNQQLTFSQAFAKTKRQMINSGYLGHPYFWSAFILIGN